MNLKNKNKQKKKIFISNFTSGSHFRDQNISLNKRKDDGIKEGRGKEGKEGWRKENGKERLGER